jgi:hypothetical protein
MEPNISLIALIVFFSQPTLKITGRCWIICSLQRMPLTPLVSITFVLQSELLISLRTVSQSKPQTPSDADLKNLVYSLDDAIGDTTFSNFNINKVPSYVFSVLKDIRGINSNLKVHIIPWSPVTAPALHSASTHFFLAWLDER